MKIYAALNPEHISNVYLVTDDNCKSGIIINPGSFSYNIYKLVQSTEVEIKKIIITQNSEENINGIPLIKKIYNAEIFAFSENVFSYKVIKVSEGFIIKEGELELRILETPVNTFDSVSILTKDAIFVGNIMQAGTLSSFEEKKFPSIYEYNIIKNKLLNLGDNIVIYPGKGPATTMEIEKKYNPFFKKILGN